MESYNTIELRYASMELAENNFVKEKDYEQLQEDNEILRAERSHWYHMYNQEVANGAMPD